MGRNKVVCFIHCLIYHRVLKKEEVVEAEQKHFVVINGHSFLTHKARLGTASRTCLAITIALSFAIQVA